MTLRTITATITDPAGEPDNTEWVFISELRGADGKIITTRPKTVKPVAGLLTVQLEPGPTIAQFGGRKLPFLVPDHNEDLWVLLSAAVGVPVTTPADLLAAAVQTFVENNPGYPWSGISGKPDVDAKDWALADSTSDDRAALVAADTVAGAAGSVLMLPPGTYRVASDLTFSAPVLALPGAKLKPDSGVIVKLTGGVLTHGLYQVFDHSAGGKCVPLNVDYYHPAWWGPTNTSDDSATWNHMLEAADSYTAWQPAQQRIMVPQGTNRLWQVELNNVHLEGNGRSSWIRPASTASPGDPVNSDTGYVVKLGGTTTVSGVEFDTASVAGITLIAWCGSQINMIQSHVVVRSVGSVGIWAFGGGLGVRLVDCMITGEYGTPSGTGIRAQGTAYDGKLTNVIVKDLDTGIDLNTASWQFTNVHVYGCTGNGIQGVGADNSKFVACWFDKNALWGLKLDSSSNVIVDSATWFYRNGSGGMILSSDTTANRCKGNRVDAIFDDNTAYGLYLKDAIQTSGDLRFTSGSVLSGGSALCTTGVYIGSGAAKTHLRALTSLTWPVTGQLVNNQCTTAMVQRDLVEEATEAVGGTTTLSLDSTMTRRFYGTGNQTCKLPTNGVGPGQEWSILNGSTGVITVQSSNGAAVASISAGRSAKFQSKVATPITAAHWSTHAGGSVTGTDANTAALRDDNANLSAAGFIPSVASTPTAGATTTLDISSYQIQEFTGITTQTVKLPTTSVPKGKEWTIRNASSGVVTVQSSDGSTILPIPGFRWATFRANTATPTTGSDWTVTAVAVTSTSYAPSTAVLRDMNANIFANNVVVGRNSTATSGGTLTLSMGDAGVQVLTGSTTHTVKLPTTSVVAGQPYTVINESTGTVTVQSSDGTTLLDLLTGRQAVFMARADTPTGSAHWAVIPTPTTAATGSAYSPSSVVMRDASGVIHASAFMPGRNSTVTAAGTTTLSSGDAQVQVFTGSTTQTVKLPTTSLYAGMEYTVINNSSGVVTVQSSGANTIDTVAGGSVKIFLAQVDTPTTAAHWRVFTPSA